MQNGEVRDFGQEYGKLTEKDRKLPSGFMVRHRALGVGEWIAIWGSVPRLASVADGDGESALKDDVLEKTQTAVVAASVMPKLYMDLPHSNSLPGTMSVKILSDEDLADYLKGIAEMMGYGTKSADEASGALKA